MVKGWGRLTWILNDELEKLRLYFSRCTNCDIASYFVIFSSCLLYVQRPRQGFCILVVWGGGGEGSTPYKNNNY